MLHENALHRAALAYAEKGYPVFPIEPKGKAPLGQLVPNGVSNASNSFERVNYWWEKASQANIGLAVEASNFIVIDLTGTREKRMAWKPSRSCEALTHFPKPSVLKQEAMDFT